MYPILRDMLMSRALSVRLTGSHIVVDTNLEGQGVAPDLAIYMDARGKVLRSPDYLYGIIEAKPGNVVSSHADRIFFEKNHYIQAGTRWFYLIDQTGVARRDLEALEPTWHLKTWAEIKTIEVFEELFQPISLRELRLENQLDAFEAGNTRTAYRDVERFGRRRFIRTIREVAELLTRAVGEVTKQRIIPSVGTAKALISEMETRWGSPVFDWTPGRGHPVEFEKVGLSSTAMTLSQAEGHRYAEDHAKFASLIAPHLDALRLEVETLPIYAAKLGKNEISFLKTDKYSKRAVTIFVYETASLILSRMLMVRFSEDHDFLSRQISNGGIHAFAGYSKYFNEPYQSLLKQAYKSARKLYRDLFDPHSLDWVLDSEDGSLSRALQQAMLLLSRWNFRTVKGDILSGVYDHYLEAEKRRDLGEVFTRPEIARYVLQACKWTRDKTLLDPACGTGTFLVEALRGEIERLSAAGAFDLSTAAAMLDNIRGLDINPFSVSLTQIQILWHMIGLFEGRSSEEIRDIAKSLLPLINVDGGISSLETMGRAMHLGQQHGLDLGTGRQHQGRRRTHDFPIKYRRINGSAYDVVVGNPPYVRAHRRTKEALAEDYAEVAVDQWDLYILFLYRALRWWVKPGGRMGFVIPMSALDAGYAKNFRAVLREHKIVEIVDLELLRKKTFHGVKRPVVILIVERTPATNDDTVLLTTVAEDAYDAEADTVDMSKASTATVSRSHLWQTNWLPDNFLRNTNWLALVDVATGDGAEITTKIQSGDHSILAKIGEAPRLAESIDQIWVRRNDSSDFKLEVEDRELNDYRLALLIQDGIKLGSTDATSATEGMNVWKGLNIFPGGLLGNPIGKWNVGKEQELRLYRYQRVLDHSRLFAARQIGQVPTICLVPQNAVFQNTAIVFQLKEFFPLNAWVVSRIVQFYCSKVLRASIIEDITAHWYKRQICLLPMPIELSCELVSQLNDKGRRLFDADRTVANRYRDVQTAIDSSSNTLRDLIVAGDERTLGIDLTGVPTAETLVSSLALNEHVLSCGPEWVAVIPHPLLRRWVAHRIIRETDLSDQLFGRATVLNLEIPDNLLSALDALDRFECADAEGNFEAALDELDEVVGSCLGLTTDQIQYVKIQMQTDPFLKHINPMWEKRGLSRQRYLDAEEEET